MRVLLALDDGVPDGDFVVGVLRAARAGVADGEIGKDLLCVPVEEGFEVGVEREVDEGVFLRLSGRELGAATDSVDSC